MPQKPKHPKYQKLLANAPDHLSPEFIDYLREHNTVVWDQPQWLVIENVKYHTPEKPWLTAFHKKGINVVEAIEDMDILYFQFHQSDLLIKAAQRRTVQRFHVHIIHR